MQLREIGHVKEEIYINPEVKIDSKIKRLRQANFKMQYKQRMHVSQFLLAACGFSGVLFAYVCAPVRNKYEWWLEKLVLSSDTLQ